MPDIIMQASFEKFQLEKLWDCIYMVKSIEANSLEIASEIWTWNFWGRTAAKQRERDFYI